VSDPFLLVQLGDPHIGVGWAPGDPVAGLAAAVESVRAMESDANAVLLSGDLADHGADDE
jgi:3',5'-cyclic AMP phosphodiesterase CpdA